MPALYISDRSAIAVAVAVAEYEQDLAIRPGMLCAYETTVAGILDLRDGSTCSNTGIDQADLRCPWKQIAFIEKRRPPTWDIARRPYDAGAAGIRVPSVQVPEGVNLVLWRWNDTPNRKVIALDPIGDLPKDQKSWQP